MRCWPEAQGGFPVVLEVCVGDGLRLTNLRYIIKPAGSRSEFLPVGLLSLPPAQSRSSSVGATGQLQSLLTIGISDYLLDSFVDPGLDLNIRNHDVKKYFDLGIVPHLLPAQDMASRSPQLRFSQEPPCQQFVPFWNMDR